MFFNSVERVVPENLHADLFQKIQTLLTDNGLGTHDLPRTTRSSFVSTNGCKLMQL